METKENEIFQIIRNTEPLEEFLHAIIVYSNPYHFKRRLQLAKEFINRIEKEPNVILYVVEMIYDESDVYEITDKENPRHLQLKTDTILWHKENMINIGVEKLLPPNWKAFAWIDADIEFENPSWALDTLKILNVKRDIVKLFSHEISMDQNQMTLQFFSSYGYQYEKHKNYNMNQKMMDGIPDMKTPGYAWAMTRNMYEKIEGLYEYCIIGSGDTIMTMCLVGLLKNYINNHICYSEDYYHNVMSYQQLFLNNTFSFSYVPGIVHHYYHGSVQNRNYVTRHNILKKFNYSPSIHLFHDEQGVITPTPSFPTPLKESLRFYFFIRNEDENTYDMEKKQSLMHRVSKYFQYNSQRTIQNPSLPISNPKPYVNPTPISNPISNPEPYVNIPKPKPFFNIRSMFFR